MGFKQIVMYINILDYENGKVIIQKVPEDTDVEEFVSEKYGADNTFYMTTLSLNLEVNNS